MNEKNQDLHQLLISGGTSTVPLLLPWMEPQDTVEIRALSTGEILELQRAIESEALSLREITPSYLVSVISKVRNKGVVSPVKSLTLLNSLWVLYRIIDFTYDGVTIQEGGKSYRLSLCPDTPSLWFENPDDWEEYKERAREEAPDMYEMLAPIVKVERDEEKGKVLLWVFLDTINRVVKIEPPNSENEKKFVVKWWTVIKEIANVGPLLLLSLLFLILLSSIKPLPV